MKKLNTKMIIELFLIPIAVAYLYYIVLGSHPKANLIVMSLIILFTSLEFAIKYIREVYIYKSDKNLFKVLISIFSIFTIIITILNLFIKNNIINTIFIIFIILLLLFIVYFVINNFKNVNKENKFTKSIISIFFALLSFFTILIGLILLLK